MLALHSEAYVEVVLVRHAPTSRGGDEGGGSTAHCGTRLSYYCLWQPLRRRAPAHICTADTFLSRWLRHMNLPNGISGLGS